MMRRPMQALWIVAAVLLSALALSPSSNAQDPFRQIKLTEKMVSGFIAAQPDMLAIAEKLQGSGTDAPDAKMQAELEAAAKKHGFKDFSEYDDAAANITMIMMAIDPQSGKFTDPVDAIKADIEQLKGDTTISDKERKQRIEEFEEELKLTERIKFPENVELIQKNQAKLAEVLQ
ncbi:MAG: hypothetical protein KGP27_00665 [Hyphomicrobiales bacterium]|nr:hypothetical protein [Hyphomicrobiales bacterium]